MKNLLLFFIVVLGLIVMQANAQITKDELNSIKPSLVKRMKGLTIDDEKEIMKKLAKKVMEKKSN